MKTDTNRLCSVDGCLDYILAKGLCRKHYYRLKKTGTTLLQHTRQPCAVCGKPSHANGLCQKHYATAKRHPDNPTYTEKKKICVIPDCASKIHRGHLCHAHYLMWQEQGEIA